MRDSEANLSSGQLPQSVYAQQLQRGFGTLRFDAPLEAEFRAASRAELAPQIRRNLWLGVAFVIAFSLLTHLVIDTADSRKMDLIRMLLFCPLLALALVVTYSRAYERIFPLVCLIGAPIFGIGVAVIAVLAAQSGVSLLSTVVMVSIFVYLMLGMLFRPALGTGLAICVAYILAARLASLPGTQLFIDASMLLFTNVVGAMSCYTLERANRTNFLEERLLIEAASLDGLTGIHNRRVFDEHINRIWPQALRDKAPLALLLVDIDHFKAFNDHYGHQAGDECLKQVARCLSRCARRPLDVTARYGGEEFAVVLYEAGRDHVEEAARRIQAEIEALAVKHEASPFASRRLTVSIGAACIEPVAGRSQYGFIQLADEALYAAKERGRDCVVIMDKKDYAQLSTGAFRRSTSPARATVAS
jgi:diguanylate cyclase (GGDEF)-like protein